MSEYIAGPWENDDGEIQTAEHGLPICTVPHADDFPCYDGDPEELDAEYRKVARLITAAPDLLAACVAVVETDGFIGSAIMRKRIDAMRAAIAKATE